jgi:hypothetical protein
MDLFIVPESQARGVFRLLSELSARHLEIVERHQLEEAEAEAGYEEEAYADEGITVSIITADVFGCWWFDGTDCAHDIDCACGPVTLLEVLMNVAALDRQAILTAHQARIAALWDHFWSGDALLAGRSTDLGTACAECLLSPLTHLPYLYETARELSSELGEALAAFHADVQLGAPRWP